MFPRDARRRSPATASALFLHVLAVVLAFGPTFGYALFFSVVAASTRAATPAILAGIQKSDRYLVNPGMLVVLLAGHLPAGRRPLCEPSESFVSVGFLAIIVLFGMPARLLPADRRARRWSSPSATWQAGDTLSDEYEAVSQRIGPGGKLAGLIVASTIFFMVVQALTALPVSPQADSSPPIAMFDSGVGGLTVLHECLVSLPEEDFVYLGDTAMFPYGTSDPERLRERIRAIAELLLGDARQAAGDRLQHGDLDRRGRRARGRRRARRRGRARGRAAGRDRRGDHRQRPGRGAGDAEHGRERRLPPCPRSAGPGASR